MMRKFSSFRSVKATHPDKTLTLDEYVKAIQTNKTLKAKTETYRRTGDQSIKETTRSVIVSGVWQDRTSNTKRPTEPSNIVALDFDFKDAEDLRDVNFLIDFASEQPDTLFVHRSLGGKGVHVFHRAEHNGDPLLYSAAIRGLIKRYEANNFQPDKAATNIKTLMISAYDEDAYYNPDAELMPEDEFIIETEDIERVSNAKVYGDDYFTGVDFEAVREYDRKATIKDFADTLTARGWRPVPGNPLYYTRPGKNSGVSASILKRADGELIFYVFTSNAKPLEPGAFYKLFALKTILDYNGDARAAVKELGIKQSKTKQQDKFNEFDVEEQILENLEPKIYKYLDGRENITFIRPEYKNNSFERVKASEVESIIAGAAKELGIKSITKINKIYDAFRKDGNYNIKQAKPEEVEHLLYFKQGVLDLHKDKFIPYDKNNIPVEKYPVCMLRMGVDYNPDAGNNPKEFLDFLYTVFQNLEDPEAVVKVLRRAFAVMLDGSDRPELAFFFDGVASNGKSTILDTIAMVMGDYKGKLSEAVFTNGDYTGDKLARAVNGLFMKRFAYITEYDARKQFNAVGFKELTSKSEIEFRRLYQEPVFARPTHTLFFAGNGFPDIRDLSNGVWRRIVYFPMLTQFKTVREGGVSSKEIEEKFLKEGSAIFNWIYEEYKKYVEEKRIFPIPNFMKNYIFEIKDDRNPLSGFIEAATVKDKNGFVPSTILYAAYGAYMEYYAKTKQKWGEQHFYNELPNASGALRTRKWIDGKKYRGYSGIKLNSKFADLILDWAFSELSDAGKKLDERYNEWEKILKLNQVVEFETDVDIDKSEAPF